MVSLAEGDIVTQKVVTIGALSTTDAPSTEPPATGSPTTTSLFWEGLPTALVFFAAGGVGGYLLIRYLSRSSRSSHSRHRSRRRRHA